MATIKKASRRQVKIKLGFSGPAGAGKTMSALLTAHGLCDDWNKILLIDTENGSGELYSNLGDYNVITLSPPFTPESYVDAIKTSEAAGMEVIIIDSVSAEWEGKGGLLETHSAMSGNSFTNWGKITPRHNKFIESILQSKCHVICTLRTKTDYVLVEKNGKQVPEKVGLKAITREGWEYDLTLVFDLDIKQNATASKDRTNLFMNKPQFVPSEETGKLIKQWCESGIDVVPPVDPIASAIAEMLSVTTIDELQTKWRQCKQYQTNATFIAAKDQMKVKLTPGISETTIPAKNEDLVGEMHPEVQQGTGRD